MTGFRAPLATVVTVLSADARNCDALLANRLSGESSTESSTVCGITTDTRTVEAGELFFALEGETFDGHAFARQAVEKGAIAAVTRKDVLPIETPFPYIEVEDTLAAYQQIGRWWRQQCNIPVVAITGSVGKTTSKEIISAALGQFGAVLKTQANFNNEIGVPKTLLNIEQTHDYAVVEMGMRGLEEIALLAQIAEPTVGWITNVGTAHIGRLGSRSAIAQAKCELLRELPAESTAVLNGDDDLLMKTAAQYWSGRTITYGLDRGEVRGQLVGDRVVVEDIAIPLPLPGRHNALNLLGAIATLKALNLDWQKLAAGFSVSMPAGRAQMHKLPGDIWLLDETYNAGTEAMVAALQLLADQPGTRRIAVLGTMKELGEQSVALHRQVGETVRALGIDRLLILADPAEAEAMAAGAGDVSTEMFAHHNELAAHIKAQMQAGDRLLFKASRSVAMDKVVDCLLKDFKVIA